MIGALILLAAMLGIYWLLLGRPRFHLHHRHECHRGHRSFLRRGLMVAGVGLLLSRYHNPLELVLLIAGLAGAALVLAVVALARRRRARRTVRPWSGLDRVTDSQAGTHRKPPTALNQS